MMEVPKLKPYRDANYLKFIRSKPCGVCNRAVDVEAHHVRKYCFGSGGSQKPHDYCTVPRCFEFHHNPAFNDSHPVWQMAEREIINLLMEYIQSKL